MKPLRTRLEGYRKNYGSPWEVLEKDYLLSWIIAGIASHKVLAKLLVFKGGTALKKCYFGNYRFSEDIDFSSLPDLEHGDKLEAAMREACASAESAMNLYFPAIVKMDRYLEKEPHPGNQEAFIVRAKFPWHREPTVRIMIEVTHDEQLLMPPSMQKIIHDYGENITVLVATYQLEEIIAEKLRAILQHTKKIHERGWSRSRARDYYDIWRILGTYRESLNLQGIPLLLEKKCSSKGISYSGIESFFEQPMLENVQKTWNQWLGPLVRNLPDSDIVLSELMDELQALLIKDKVIL